MSAKRCTMLAGIFSDGPILRPFIIIGRKTIEEELIAEGYNQDVVSFSHNDKGFIDMISFEILAQNVFFPEIFRRRQEDYYDGNCWIIFDGRT